MPARALASPGRPRLAEGFDRIRAGAGRPGRLPPGGRGRGAGRRRAPAGAGRAPTGATSTWSPSTRRASRDLDQAVLVERRGDGFRVRYAIADVALAGRPGGRGRRGRARPRGHGLHAGPPLARSTRIAIGEGAASLLPDADAAGAALDDRPRRAGEPRRRRRRRAGDRAQPPGALATRRPRGRSTPGRRRATLAAAARGRPAAAGARGRARRREPHGAGAGGRPRRRTATRCASRRRCRWRTGTPRSRC